MLTSLPPTQLANSIFRIEGEHASLADIGAMYGNKVEVVHVDGFPDDEFRHFLHGIHNKGMTSTGYNFETGEDEGAGSSNYLWAGHHWKKIRDILDL